MATPTPAPAPAPKPATPPAPAPSTPDPAMLNDWYTNYLNSTPTTQDATTSTWKPTEQSTVAGQFTALTTPGSAAQPLMDMATTAATQSANARGLTNSSIAVGEGQKAAYAAALPIAQQDAATYAQAQSENTAAKNATSMFNAGQYNSALSQQNQAGSQGFFNQQQILAASQQQASQQAAQLQLQANQIKADAQAQGRALTAQEEAQIRDLEAQAARQQAGFKQESDILKATQNYTTTRDAALFQQDLQKINAEAEAQIKVWDAQNGTKLYETYRDTSQQTYDAYIQAVQQIQTSDMDEDVKKAQIANLQEMFATRQSFINTMFTEMPQWAEDWSTFDLSFGG